jgi:hypothetical protein
MRLHQVLGLLAKRRGAASRKANLRVRRTSMRRLALEALEVRSLLSVSPVASFVLAPGNDSVVPDSDHTPITTPTVTGTSDPTADGGDTVSIYADTNNNGSFDPPGSATPDQLVGTGTIDASGNWTVAWNANVVSPTVANLNDPTYWPIPDGARTLFATVTDASNNVSGAVSLSITIDSTIPTTTINLTVASNTGLDVPLDPPPPATPMTNITSVATPTLTGTTTPGATVNVYADTTGNGSTFNAGDLLIGTGTADATTGVWTVPWNSAASSLNDPLYFPSLDGERYLFATATATDAGTGVTTTSPPALLTMFLDTGAPSPVAVDLEPSGDDVFGAPPSPASMQNQSEINITFEDTATRTADYANNNALNYVISREVPFYQLTGQVSGNVQILSANPFEGTVAGGPGFTIMRLTLAHALADDVYTLTLFPGLVNDANIPIAAGAGNFTTVYAPDGVTVVALTAQFQIQGAMSLGMGLSGYTQFDDTGAAGPQVSTSAAAFALPSDMLFAGNFADPVSGLADGFSKLAAYGYNKAQGGYRFLFQNEDGSVTSVPSPIQRPAMPVAADFDPAAGDGDQVALYNLKGSTWEWDILNINLGAGTAAIYQTVPAFHAGGLPVAGFFEDSATSGVPADLAVYSNGNFYVAFGANNWVETDAVLPVTANFSGFSSPNVRPIATPPDAAGFSDLGLWVPDNGVPSTAKNGDWFFFPSNDLPLVTPPPTPPAAPVTVPPAVPQYVSFGSSVGVPLVGDFLASAIGATPLFGPRATAAVHGALAAAPGTTVPASTLKVNGTAGNDTFNLAPGKLPGTWILTIDGKAQTIAANVTHLNLDGLGGTNSIVIHGTGHSECVQIWPTHLIFRSGSLTVTAADVTNTSVIGGGNDQALLMDAQGSNSLLAKPGVVTFSGKGFSEQVQNFAAVSAAAASGTLDTADLYPGLGQSAASGIPALVSMSGGGKSTGTAFFSKVQIHANTGAITKTYVWKKGAGTGQPPKTLPPINLSKAVPLKTGVGSSTAAVGSAAALLAATPASSQQSKAILSPAPVDAVLANYS